MTYMKAKGQCIQKLERKDSQTESLPSVFRLLQAKR